jgi:phosphate starvation-inducible PhoH-like protein
MTTKVVDFEQEETVRLLYGRRDSNLKALQTTLGIDVNARGNRIHLDGPEEKLEVGERVLEELYEISKQGFHVDDEDISRIIDILQDDPETAVHKIFTDQILVADQNEVITPKGINQKRYVDAMRDNDIVFGIGPAGTGKTYLAMAMALASYFDGKVKRILLVRPAVEAGEKLGFLPGDISEKVNPYLRPLHDAINDMVDNARAEKMMDNGDVEVAPLAFMRGRTLNDSFIILDEAQNTTSDQMKMFLTRLGFGSKALITGDITQIDLPGHESSGLVQAHKILKGIDGIEFCRFSENDVVRHPLVQQVINAYEANEQP